MKERQGPEQRWLSAAVLVALCVCTGTTLAGAGELVVDDFADRNLESSLGLAWMVITDDVIGGQSRAELAMAGNGSSSTAALSGELRKGDQVPFVFAGMWTAVGADGRARDLSAYEGVAVRARAKAGRYQVGTRRAGASANFVGAMELGPEWKEVKVPFSSFRPLVGPGQEAPEWQATDVTWVGISTTGNENTALQLEVDRIAFYGGPDAAHAKESSAASGSRTARVRLRDASPLRSLRWKELSRDPAGDAQRPNLPDATALSWARDDEDRIWFRISLAAEPPRPWLGVNIAMDVDGKPDNGTAWWGSNSEFHFDELISAYLTRTESYWMGAVGVAPAEDFARNVVDSSSSDVRVAVDEKENALLVGVPLEAMPRGEPIRLIATVGSAMVNNDDVPDTGAVVLTLPVADPP